MVEDIWLPIPNPFKVLDPSFLSVGFRVSELRHVNGRWNFEFISQLFDEKTTRCIWSIHVDSMEHGDILIWHHTKDEKFTVKSDYKTTMILKEEVESSNPSVIQAWWKSL